MYQFMRIEIPAKAFSIRTDVCLLFIHFLSSRKKCQWIHGSLNPFRRKYLQKYIWWIHRSIITYHARKKILQVYFCNLTIHMTSWLAYLLHDSSYKSMNVVKEHKPLSHFRASVRSLESDACVKKGVFDEKMYVVVHICHEWMNASKGAFRGKVRMRPPPTPSISYCKPQKSILAYNFA